jgi:hypothetical protein
MIDLLLECVGRRAVNYARSARHRWRADLQVSRSARPQIDSPIGRDSNAPTNGQPAALPIAACGRSDASI